MDGFWDDYFSIDVPIAVGAAVFTALALRFRMWLRGELHEDAPIAYWMAYLAIFAPFAGSSRRRATSS